MCDHQTTEHLLSIKNKVQQIITDSINDPQKPANLDFLKICCLGAERWLDHLGQSGEFIVLNGVPDDNNEFYSFIREKMKALGLSDAIEIQTMSGHL